MAARKWLIRSLSLVFLALLVIAFDWLHGWMKPSFIREQLIAEVQKQFVGVDVEVRSAHIRLFGGISVTDLKLIRADDPTRTPFLYIPSAILFHDKEQLGKGKLVIRKIELDGPTITLERDQQGRWQLLSLLRPAEGDGAVPSLNARGVKVRYVDRRVTPRPLLEVSDAMITLMNDPKTHVTIKAEGNCPRIGPFAVGARIERRSGAVSSVIDLVKVPLNAALMKGISGLSPESREYLEGLNGSGSARIAINLEPGPQPIVSHDVRFELNQCSYQHSALPMDLNNIRVRGQLKNGKLNIEQASANSGETTFRMSLEFQAFSPMVNLPEQNSINAESIESRIEHMLLDVENLDLCEEFCEKIPGKMKALREKCQPSGNLNLKAELTRRDGIRTRHFTIRPQGMKAEYEEFHYPLKNIRGTLEQVQIENQPDQLSIDLTATVGDNPVTLRGSVIGERPDLTVDLKIQGRNVDIGEKIVAALPEPYPAMIRKFHASASADVTILIRHNEKIRKEYGNVFDNQFTIDFLNGKINYDEFPYPLDNLKGTLVIRSVPSQPTRLPPIPGVPASTNTDKDDTGVIEFRNIEGRNNGGVIRVSGSRESKLGVSWLSFDIAGENVSFNEDLRNGFSALKLDHIWTSFTPRGRMNCRIIARVTDRAGIAFDPRRDLQLGAGINGSSLLPAFFPWQMDQVQFQLSYGSGRVHLNQFNANHNGTRLSIPFALIELPSGGGFWARFTDLKLNQMKFDWDLLKALPESVRSAIENMQLRGNLDCVLREFVISDLPGNQKTSTPQTSEPVLNVAYAFPTPETVPIPLPRLASGKTSTAVIFWDGTVVVKNGTIRAGVLWENVEGQVACRGIYQGDQPGQIIGNIAINRATILKQPIEEFFSHFEIDPKQPDVIDFRVIKARLYGGEIGGEARLVLKNPTRYDLRLNATRIQLAEVANQQKLGPKAQLSGEAQAKLHLTNQDDSRNGAFPVMQGAGTIDVDDGKLLNLPLTLDLLKVLNGRVPDQTAFEQAHVLFLIRGNRLKFGQLDFIGNAISLGGEGEMNLDGTDLRLEFYGIWSNILNALAIEPVEQIFAKLSQKLFRIVVSGRVDGKLKYEKELVPGLVDPIRRIIGTKDPVYRPRRYPEK